MRWTRLVGAILLAAGAAEAEMVTARWGVQGPVQHPGALKYEPAGNGAGTVMIFDLSALPKGAKVYGARLFFFGTKWNDVGFDIVPVEGTGEAAKAAGPPLRLVEPFFQWFDATAAAQAWAKADAASGRLLLRKAPRFIRDATFLEIAYEGKPDGPPRQVSAVKAFCRSGQVFITFKETQPPDEGKDQVSWGDLVQRFQGDYYGPVPGDGGAGQDGPRQVAAAPRDLCYRVVRLDRPITPANVGEAELLGEVLPGSAFNTRQALRTDERSKRQDVVAISAGRRGEAMASGTGVILLRLAVEPGKPVEPGTGVFVHTVKRGGRFHYAVLASLNGVTNAVEITDANTSGPVEQKPGEPEPVLYKEIVTEVGGTKYVEGWYSFWTDQPLSPWPARYDVVVGHCPDLLAKPAPLHIHRSGWNSWATPPGPHRTTGINMAHTADMPVEFHTGLNDGVGTLKGFEGGKFQTFFANRQEALVRWMLAKWPVDKTRVSADLASWGMQEIKRGDTYAYISGGGLPELTKGWQAWERACGIWGRPEMYRGRPDEENPYVVSNVTDWVLAHPEKRLPYCWTSAPGAHESEMGWPPYPRFIWAMMETKHPVLYDYSRQTPVGKAIASGQIRLRLDQSMPAFAHCSLDDNIGDGELGSGLTLCPAQVNGYLLWDTATIVDEPISWQMTIWLDGSAPFDDCTVDLTPRYCQKFKATEGQKFIWSNGLLAEAEEEVEKQADRQAKEPVKKPLAPGGLVQSDTATAGKYGLVTINGLRISKAKHRITIKPTG